ncbi:MAG: UDP-N-acetylmuramate dehydrogenase [Chitinophagaceae bacterium]|nr:UDP-N-acetylmuramate dehydrogenase [Chitinophagaceae bacterium]
MQIQQNISLRPYNTFGVNVACRQFAAFQNTDELIELLNSGNIGKSGVLILGGGSNMLLTKNLDSFVLKNDIKGIEELHEDKDFVYVRAGAGENWHEFVSYCTSKGWAGLENLSLIPGNVGASPMQNIGAYGVEVKDLFWDLEALHLKEKKIQTFTLMDCAFGYRDSIFKNKYKDQFVILNVTFRLRKRPIFHTNYGAITQELERMRVTDLSIKAIAEAIINIRSSKLPDPKLIGNAGSFFKNPLVKRTLFEKLKKQYPGIVGFDNPDGTVKLAAGWLIEQCGPAEDISWKGYRVGDVGCYPKQALVLVNYGNATGTEVFDLSTQIVQSVRTKFNVTLEREVNVI